MQVGLVQLGLAGRADGPDDVAFRDCGALAHRRRAELDERDRESVGGLDRHGDAVLRDGAREGHRASSRGPDGSSGLATDVDAAMLASRVRIVSEDERLQNRAVGWPGPRLPCGHNHEGSEEGSNERASHR